MKIALLILFVFLAEISGGLWISHAKPFQTASQHLTTPALSPTVNPPPRVDNTSFSNEWQKYHTTREQTLRANPELANEYKSLLAEIHQHDEEVNAAMIRVDPKVAPILAKLALLRQPNAGSPQASVSTGR